MCCLGDFLVVVKVPLGRFLNFFLHFHCNMFFFPSKIEPPRLSISLPVANSANTAIQRETGICRFAGVRETFVPFLPLSPSLALLFSRLVRWQQLWQLSRHWRDSLKKTKTLISCTALYHLVPCVDKSSVLESRGDGCCVVKRERVEHILRSFEVGGEAGVVLCPQQMELRKWWIANDVLARLQKGRGKKTVHVHFNIALVFRETPRSLWLAAFP